MAFDLILKFWKRPKYKKVEVRFPCSAKEANAAYRYWQKSNARYSSTYEATVDNQKLMLEVNGSSGLVALVNGAPITEYPDYFGKKLANISKK